KRFLLAPTLLWLSASDAMLQAIVWIGLVASVAIILNLWPRVAIAVAGVAFLSFIAAAQDFSAYQSDGMLLEAALLSIFLAPRGLRPGFAPSQPVNAGALFMLRWEWFRIYFESGVVKLLSGETQWRDLTAMDTYYENGPLQIAIIVTANYAFLNYLVLFLGVLLVDDFRASPAEGQTRVPLLHRVIFGILFVTTIFSFFARSFPLVTLLEPFRVANSYGLFA